MPVSKKRKRKDGSVAKFKRDRYERRRRQIAMDIEGGAHMATDEGVTLQDLINMVAYQEYQEKGLIDGPAIPDDAPMSKEEMLKGPEAESVIRALSAAKKYNQHGNLCDLEGCYGQFETCAYKITDEEESEDGRQ